VSEETPRASRFLSQDFYIDDVLSVCGDITEAIKLHPDLIALLASAGFPLRKMVFQP
jgi:hypothetical protein